ncbi:MAG TPA: putative capsular polysaccharide synthesis family protein [Ignavibacteria bacterium]|nr:putative capsular polysaccharide synthesis family protein [Ignavibacteria bacterium]HMR41624.1 putative capsular polysaccharide synthesis family protein [Ignavibacteria bacterium]
MKDYSPYYGDIIIDKEHHPIIVYIIGKVGSKTVVESLYNIEDIPFSIYHAHLLAPKSDQQIEEESKKSSFKSTQDIVSFNDKLGHFIRENFDEFSWNIITLVRDPFAISLSMFFELIDSGSIDKSYPELIKDGNLNATFEEFSELFHSACFKHIMYVEKWFEEELKTVFGINVLDHSFDTSKGYSIIKKDNVNLLIIRTENLNKSLKNAIKDFIGIEDIEMIKDNVGDDKYYSNVYKFIKEKFTLKELYAKDIYSSENISKLVRHFYSEDEINAFISKWTREKYITDEDYERYDIDKENIFKNVNDVFQKKKIHHKIS